MIFNLKNIKKSFIIATLLCLVMVLGTSANVSANESDKSIKLSYGENYENKETGEYFRWVTSPTKKGIAANSVAKEFEFKIRFSVESDGFTIDSSSVDIDSTAWVEDVFGNVESGYEGHKYTVQLSRLLTTKSLQFDIDGTESGTISGLTSGGTYKIKIINNDYIPDGQYLVGYGSVTNN
ncbi:hypothetical protein MKZ15_01655 [Paenibacillus sp. FSL R7-0216]|uniref:hypothetical protein n=1 Tax=Paenibacillus sp. FSL R7-0216 TaxID=2921677 RepID=UPI000F95EBC3